MRHLRMSHVLYEWIMSHICLATNSQTPPWLLVWNFPLSPSTDTKQHLRIIDRPIAIPYKGFVAISYKGLRQIPYMGLIYCISQVTRMIGSCHTYECVMAHKWISHVLNIVYTHLLQYCNTLQLTAAECNTLQHSATHRNTLQHTAWIDHVINIEYTHTFL